MAAPAAAQNLGVFESQTDVGRLLHPGQAEFDSNARTYTLASSNENLRDSEDGFHFVWRKISGDVSIAARIAFSPEGGNVNREGALMIRRTLDPDSEYVGAAIHFSGKTALQSRSEKGGFTHEVQSYLSAPQRIRLIKTGSYFFLYAAGNDGVFHFSGGSMQLQLNAPFYIGLASFAHDRNSLEKVVFSEVEITALPPSTGKPIEYSTLETQTTERRAVWAALGHFLAPHFSQDGKTIFFTVNGRIARIPASGDEPPELIDTGNLTHIDAHTGFSPDGTMFAVTDHDWIYAVPAAGGPPQRVTVQSPSQFYDWSPDGKTILFIGIRDGRRRLLTIPAQGGPESTIESAWIENPAWSPDGKFIWFDSFRGGIDIWRMPSFGSSAPEAITSEHDFINSSPHVSPDGRHVAILSADRGSLFVRVMDLDPKSIRVIAEFPHFLGVLGTSPWSPDSNTLAFVSYQFAPF